MSVLGLYQISGRGFITSVVGLIQVSGRAQPGQW